MYSYCTQRNYICRKKHWSASAVFRIGKNQVDCKVQVDFSKPDAVDFQKLLAYYQASYCSKISFTGSSNGFEVSIRISFDALNQLTSLLSDALEPLGCEAEGILGWMDDEVKKIQSIQSCAGHSQTLMPAPRRSSTQAEVSRFRAKL